jgi:undecaprenyl-diphosphatase
LSFFQIAILAVIQGAAELLPVSSSAHVIVAEKLMGLDPTAPQLTLLLVMLHTGTMFAVVVYFWKAWRRTFFDSMQAFRRQAANVIIATAATGVVGLLLMQLLKRVAGHGAPEFEVEQLFGNTRLIAAALAFAGILIIVAARSGQANGGALSPRAAAVIGAVQGLCLPFRGFSRSGATISAGMLLRVPRQLAEEFSFALAVVLTPPVIVREVLRLAQASSDLVPEGKRHAIGASLLGMALAFVAGLVALRWLSRWLEQGRWHYFGAYCLAASLVVLWVG